MAFFTAYLDDSGTSGNEPIAVCCSLIIPCAQIPTLDSHWNTFCKKYGFEDFHASEFAYSNKHQIFSSWALEKKNKVVERVISFCMKFGVQCFGFAIKKETYALMPPEMGEASNDDHYSFAARNTLTLVEIWRRERRIKEIPLHVFDHENIGSEKRLRIDALMKQLEEHNREEVRYGFEHRKKVPGLQCADFVAWTAYQLSRDNFEGKKMHIFAERAVNRFEAHIPGQWFRVATIMRDEFKRWIDEEIGHKKSIGSFLDFYSRYPGAYKK